MRLGRILILGVTFMGGGLSQWAYTRLVSESLERKVEQLWRQVAQYNAHLEDPKNRQWDLGVNAWRVAPLFDLDPILAQLVWAGELDHFDVVLLTVPEDSRSWRRLFQFAQAHPEIIEFRSGPEYPAGVTKGPQPLHLHLWMKKENEATLKGLIQSLEATAGEESPAGA